MRLHSCRVAHVLAPASGSPLGMAGRPLRIADGVQRVPRDGWGKLVQSLPEGSAAAPR